jgi:Tfp pilus assembly protein PilF
MPTCWHGPVAISTGRSSSPRNADAAFWQFRYVTANAEPPVAQYQYHLALALMELDRDAEARIALERALAIDPQFADAKSAREELARLSAAAAKPVESS